MPRDGAPHDCHSKKSFLPLKQESEPSLYTECGNGRKGLNPKTKEELLVTDKIWRHKRERTDMHGYPGDHREGMEFTRGRCGVCSYTRVYVNQMEVNACWGGGGKGLEKSVMTLYANR